MTACVGVSLAAAGAAFAQAGGTPPPPAVTVLTVKSKNLPVTYEYAGRVASSREVEVRARVGGILLERNFDEGSRVEAGTLLFHIDPATYEAQVALAKAQVLQAQAQLGQAKRTEARARQLAQSGASSQATLEDSVSSRELAEAQVAAAEAQLQTATLSLDYATVEAPVAGVTSLEQVPEGSLLSTGDLLTRISRLDPVYVNFSAADREAASIRELVESGQLQGASSPSDLTVTLMFGNGETYGETGTIDFTSTTIDSQTGTILSRAVLPNPESRLLPGQFVRLQLEGLSIENAIELPTEALMQGPQGTFVYTLNDENLAEVSPVVVKGVVKVRPGAPVNPQPAAANADAASSEPDAPAPDAPAAEAAPATDAPEPAAAEPAADTANEAAGEQQGAIERAVDAANDKVVADAGHTPGEAGRTDAPPVPLTALPDGDDARRATSDGDASSESAR
ncbi:efflux RND transporter periplasmic adaptor subunit [Aurantimonas coralicida]|uniref:efflux RND transporter periplasmic adaptor subunit n=1 Tax=Aurantimonas coralicida TaxID=182270 RepID=UPI001FCE2A09|nr:efflux RND transporter periplasmic adaptor subunit [Aurantimonas coralicida]